MLDRFGDVPRPVQALLDVALLRAAAAQEGICDISQKGQQLLFSFADTVDVPSVMAVCTMNTWRSRLLLSAGEKPKLTLYLKPKENALEAATALVEELRLKREEISGTAATQAT
jgi:transcription-repair coupling factor (superfamily II helicase)